MSDIVLPVGLGRSLQEIVTIANAEVDLLIRTATDSTATQDICKAIQKLGNLGNKNAIPALEQFLIHNNPHVVYEAAIALYKYEGQSMKAAHALSGLLANNLDLYVIRALSLRLSEEIPKHT